MQATSRVAPSPQSATRILPVTFSPRDSCQELVREQVYRKICQAWQPYFLEWTFTWLEYRQVPWSSGHTLMAVSEGILDTVVLLAHLTFHGTIGGGSTMLEGLSPLRPAWSIRHLCRSVLSIEFSVMMEIFSICTVSYGNHRLPYWICGYAILLNFN